MVFGCWPWPGFHWLVTLEMSRSLLVFSPLLTPLISPPCIGVYRCVWLSGDATGGTFSLGLEREVTRGMEMNFSPWTIM